MTTARATSVVSIERVQNVVYLNFSPSAPPPALGEEDPRRPAEVGEAPTPTDGPARPVPARYSPRPVRVLRRRFARSQFAADLRDWAWLLGLLAAGVVCVARTDHLHDLTHLMFGGPL